MNRETVHRNTLKRGRLPAERENQTTGFGEPANLRCGSLRDVGHRWENQHAELLAYESSFGPATSAFWR